MQQDFALVAQALAESSAEADEPDPVQKSLDLS
jgi:hypothetical protein